MYNVTKYPPVGRCDRGADDDGRGGRLARPPRTDGRGDPRGSVVYLLWQRSKGCTSRGAAQLPLHPGRHAGPR
eukprot:scaffold52298_cov39-Tisochrysis_lutea.AAC.2